MFFEGNHHSSWKRYKIGPSIINSKSRYPIDACHLRIQDLESRQERCQIFRRNSIFMLVPFDQRWSNSPPFPMWGAAWFQGVSLLIHLSCLSILPHPSIYLDSVILSATDNTWFVTEVLFAFLSSSYTAR